MTTASSLLRWYVRRNLDTADADVKAVYMRSLAGEDSYAVFLHKGKRSNVPVTLPIVQALALFGLVDRILERRKHDDRK